VLHAASVLQAKAAAIWLQIKQRYALHVLVWRQLGRRCKCAYDCWTMYLCNPLLVLFVV
jgi:hypothetical protein